MNMKSAVFVSQVLSGNCRLLFHKDSLCREEAATRLLWLTKPTQPHKRLADICLLDVAVTGHTPVTGMYEVQFDSTLFSLIMVMSLFGTYRYSIEATLVNVKWWPVKLLLVFNWEL